MSRLRSQQKSLVRKLQRSRLRKLQKSRLRKRQRTNKRQPKASMLRIKKLHLRTRKRKKKQSAFRFLKSQQFLNTIHTQMFLLIQRTNQKNLPRMKKRPTNPPMKKTMPKKKLTKKALTMNNLFTKKPSALRNL